MAIREITTGLRILERPVACRDVSVIVVEIEPDRATRIAPASEKAVIAESGGGPNGAAVGPDSRLYVCNSGSM